MKMLTKADRARIPMLYSQQKVEDPVVPVKFFNPTGAGSWFVIEGAQMMKDGRELPLSEPTEPEEVEDIHFYGYVTGLAADELGYMSLNEFLSYRHPRFKLGIERDLHWNPKTKLSDVKSGKVR